MELVKLCGEALGKWVISSVSDVLPIKKGDDVQLYITV